MASRCSGSRKDPTAFTPMKIPARPSLQAWASCIWRSFAIGFASSRWMRMRETQIAYRETITGGARRRQVINNRRSRSAWPRRSDVRRRRAERFVGGEQDRRRRSRASTFGSQERDRRGRAQRRAGGYPVIDVEVDIVTAVTTKSINNWLSKWQRFLQ